VPVCEQCAASFEEPEATGEVTSLRILCPSCAAERRRAKLAAQPAAGQPARPAPAPRPGVSAAGANNTNSTARPAPVKTTTTVTGAPGSAVRPASSPAPAARPASPAAKPASPGARPASTAARPAAPARPAGAPASAAPARSRTSAAASPRASESSRAPVRAPVRRSASAGSRELIVETGSRTKPMMDTATKIGLVVALLLFVTAGVVLFIVNNQKTAEKNEADRLAAAQDSLMKELRAIDTSNPDEAAKVESIVMDGKDLWLGTDLGVEVNSILAKAGGTLTKNADRADYDKRLSGIEAQLLNAATMEPKDLAELRRALRNMLVNAQQYGDEMVKRVKAAETACSRAYVNRLVADADTFIGQNPDQQRPALNKYALAEEELRSQLEEAFKTKDTKLRDELEPIYVRVISDSDRLSNAAFTDAYIEGTQWRDLLSGPELSKWKESKSSGFTWKIQDGVMRFTGPAPDSKGQAAMSIGDDEKWRDFQMEIEFTLKTGAPNLYFRLGKAADTRVKNILLEPAPAGDIGWQLDKKYELRVTFIGNRFVAVCTNAPEDFQELKVESGPGDSRRGAFGIAIPKGAEFEISKLRIKVLR
jgi:hypothetical protein